jgi:hypothetical protein
MKIIKIKKKLILKLNFNISIESKPLSNIFNLFLINFKFFIKKL